MLYIHTPPASLFNSHITIPSPLPPTPHIQSSYHHIPAAGVHYSNSTASVELSKMRQQKWDNKKKRKSGIENEKGVNIQTIKPIEATAISAQSSTKYTPSNPEPVSMCHDRWERDFIPAKFQSEWMVPSTLVVTASVSSIPEPHYGKILLHYQSYWA